MQLAIEAKSTARITNDHLKGLRNVTRDHGEVKRRIVVCLEQKARRTDDGIEILPVSKFLKSLSQGELF
jgi:predicted AAA+ superfamily ATPase